MKKKFIIFLALIFTLDFSISYFSFYKTHVKNGYLKDANLYYAGAKTFGKYYDFGVKFLDMDSPFLVLFHKPMIYLYQKGMEKLKFDEPIKSLWFVEFEVNPYNYSTNGGYGNLAFKYGKNFAKDFLENVYLNIEFINKNKEILNEYIKNGYENELTNFLLEKFNILVGIYVADLQMNIDGRTLSKDGLNLVINDKKLHQKLINLQKIKDEFFGYYEVNFPNEFHTLFEKNKNYHSPNGLKNKTSLKLSSYILIHKIKNNNFDLIKDKIYIKDIKNAKNELENLAKTDNEKKDLEILLIFFDF